MKQTDRQVAERARQLVDERRERLERILGRPLDRPDTADRLSPERREFLLEEAQELYYNELSWEQLTEEEKVDGGELVEAVFSGFLAFVEGLLLREVMPDSLAPASPRPEVVEDVLGFLARRCIELQDAEASDEVAEREVTERLIDLVLYRLHDVPVDRIDRLEPASDPDDAGTS